METTKHARDFDDSYLLLVDSQDLEALRDYYPVIDEDVTGAFVKVEDGDYSEVWLTEDSKPYLLDAIYHPLSYYAS